MEEYISGEWWESLPDMAKCVMWERSMDIRAGMPLTLRRMRNVPAQGKDSFKTELLCCGKTLTLAQMQNEDNATWMLAQWIKVLEPILCRLELDGGYIMRPSKIDDPETFVMAIVTSDAYIKNFKDESRNKLTNP